MSVLLEKVGDRLVLNASPREKDLVKRIPGGTFDRGAGAWTFAPAVSVCLIARDVFKERLEVGPQLSAWFTEARANLDYLSALKVTDYEYPPELYPFQRQGTTWLWAARQALLTDDMGLGKTIQTLRCGTPDNFPTLIICTNSMKKQWAVEWEKWGPPHGGIIVVGGTATQRRKQLAQDATVVIVNWESLRLHSRLAPYGSIELSEAERTPKELDEWNFRTVIADEVHRACLPKSKQTRAWWNLSHKAEYRYGLTGTPIRNRPDDMWPILHGLLPAEFPRKSAWVDRYCHAGQNMWGAYEIWGLKEEHKAELFSYLDPRLMRRTKAEVLPQLPAKTYSTRVVEMEGKQAKAYKDMKKEMLTDVDGEFLTADSPLTLAGRLVQLAAATPVLGEVPWTDPETGEAGSRTGVVSLTTPSCKLDALLDVLDEAPDEPLVVFASSRKLIDLCAAKLDKEKVSYVLLTGAVSPGARSQAVALFQEGEAQVALCTLGAASEGITLTRASRALFLQRSWSLVQNKQAEDRIHRIGQDAEKVEIIDIITADSIEDDVRKAGELKEGYLQEIVRDHVRGK